MCYWFGGFFSKAEILNGVQTFLDKPPGFQRGWNGAILQGRPAVIQARKDKKICISVLLYLILAG